MENRIICYILGHKIGKVGEKTINCKNSKDMQVIEFGCTRCGKKYKDDEPIYSSQDNLMQRFIRNRV